MFIERHDPQNVTTMDDGPIPDGSWLAREERNTREYLDGLMDNALAVTCSDCLAGLVE